MTCDVEEKTKEKKEKKNDPVPDPAFYWHPKNVYLY